MAERAERSTEGKGAKPAAKPSALRGKANKPVIRPASTLVKKRSLFVPLLAIIVIVIVCGLIYYFSFFRSHDTRTIMATVNGEPIYADEIAEQYNNYGGMYSNDSLLESEINTRLLLQEADRRGITASASDVEEKINSIMDQYGIAEADLEVQLARSNITKERYRELIEQGVLLEKVIQDAVISKVSVSEDEIAQYYENHSEDFTAPKGGAVISHILVANETLAEELIDRLNEGESFSQLAKDYSTDGSAGAGGYLGVVTPETNFVPEFKTAALALKENQYTKKPVKSQFGYHIILRGPDKQPFKLVHDSIQDQLKVAKQVELFKSFLAGLKKEATIKMYTAQGIVTQPAPEPSGLDAFAVCVAPKATLYGTKFSDFTKEQLALFGDSSTLLTYVDCEEKPQLCTAAEVQKYPTWVIAGSKEHLGKLSLKELADKTGCTLPN